MPVYPGAFGQSPFSTHRLEFEFVAGFLQAYAVSGDQPSNLYPTPWTVRISVGCFGETSMRLRNWEMC